MWVKLCLFSTLNRRVGALQISIIVIIINMGRSESHFTVSLIAGGKVTKTVSINLNF